MSEAARGSQAAFLALIERHERALHRFFRLSGRDAHEADDGAQETFLRLYAFRRRFNARGHGGFRALLYRIARNVLADGLRKKRRAPSCRPLDDALGLPTRAGAGALADDAIDLAWALRSLPDKLRSVVVLGVFQGLAYREVAEALRIPVGTVKSRMYFAVQRLREVLHAELRSP